MCFACAVHAMVCREGQHRRHLGPKGHQTALHRAGERASPVRLEAISAHVEQARAHVGRGGAVRSVPGCAHGSAGHGAPGADGVLGPQGVRPRAGGGGCAHMRGWCSLHVQVGVSGMPWVHCQRQMLCSFVCSIDRYAPTPSLRLVVDVRRRFTAATRTTCAWQT